MPSCTTPNTGEKQAVPFAEKRPNLTLFFTKLQKKVKNGKVPKPLCSKGFGAFCFFILQGHYKVGKKQTFQALQYSCGRQIAKKEHV